MMMHAVLMKFITKVIILLYCKERKNTPNTPNKHMCIHTYQPTQTNSQSYTHTHARTFMKQTEQEY